MRILRPEGLRTHSNSLEVEQSTPLVIIAAIPCHNEERFIGSVVLKAKRYVSQTIVVDDGSTDDSANIAEAAGAVVIRKQHVGGKGSTVALVFQEVSRLGADVLVLMDGDGQHDAGEIPKLLKPVSEGSADIVIGSRFLERGNQIPKYRILGQRILTFVTNLGSGSKLTDSQSGFRAFSRKAIHTLSFNEQGFAVESEMQFLAKEKGLDVIEVPITTCYEDKVKRNPVAHGLGVLSRVLNMISQRQPLLYLSLPGAIILLIGIRLGLFGLRNYTATTALPLGQTFVSALLCAIGLVASFTGITLHWLGIILKRGQRR